MTVLAAQEVSAGTLGLLVVVLLCVATVLLIRNMSKRLKRLPESFSPPDETDEGASDPTAGA